MNNIKNEVMYEVYAINKGGSVTPFAFVAFDDYAADMVKRFEKLDRKEGGGKRKFGYKKVLMCCDTKEYNFKNIAQI